MDQFTVFFVRHERRIELLYFPRAKRVRLACHLHTRAFCSALVHLLKRELVPAHSPTMPLAHEYCPVSSSRMLGLEASSPARYFQTGYFGALSTHTVLRFSEIRSRGPRPPRLCLNCVCRTHRQAWPCAFGSHCTTEGRKIRHFIFGWRIARIEQNILAHQGEDILSWYSSQNSSISFKILREWKFFLWLLCLKEGFCTFGTIIRAPTCFALWLEGPTGPLKGAALCHRPSYSLSRWGWQHLPHSVPPTTRFMHTPETSVTDSIGGRGTPVAFVQRSNTHCCIGAKFFRVLLGVHLGCYMLFVSTEAFHPFPPVQSNTGQEKFRALSTQADFHSSYWGPVLELLGHDFPLPLKTAYHLVLPQLESELPGQFNQKASLGFRRANSKLTETSLWTFSHIPPVPWPP